MIPLFIYKRKTPEGGNIFLVRGAADDPVYQGYELVTTIEARTWIQSFLNYDKTDRDRMVLELEGGRE